MFGTKCTKTVQVSNKHTARAII